MSVLLNIGKANEGYSNIFEPLSFHRKIFGYKPTPIFCSTELAKTLGVKNVLIKNETFRFGIPSFKILGASWAAYKFLESKLGPFMGSSFNQSSFKKWTLPLSNIILSCASDGNHGHAVALVAQWFGFRSKIFIPDFVNGERIKLIEKAGAEIILINGTYDNAVDAALENSLKENIFLLSDTNKGEESKTSDWIIEGYSTIFNEINQQTTDLFAGAEANVLYVQGGVGGLAAAAVKWSSANCQKGRNVIVVEPNSAACIQAAIKKNKPIRTECIDNTQMSYLNCGTISFSAFQALNEGLCGCVSINDEWAIYAMYELSKIGINTGPSGAAGLGGRLFLKSKPELKNYLNTFEPLNDNTLLFLVTEGV